MPPQSWLLLLYSLPATHKTERVAIWRKLKKSGAIQIKTSTSLLPDSPAQYELFQWLATQIRDCGGESTLIRAQAIEGLPDEQLVGLFNATRDREYTEVITSLRKLIRQKKRDSDFADELEKLKRQFRALREVDFFEAPRAHDVEELLAGIQGSARGKRSFGAKLAAKQFQGKTWLTRPRPEIDRVGSAWLIRRFIDSTAKFVFAPTVASFPSALPFDFPDAEFSHHGEDCTFETLLRRFGIVDKAVRAIGEMVHDADLDDEKFGRSECVGIDRVLKGWAKRGMSDEDLLRHGSACFDGLYAFLQRL